MKTISILTIVVKAALIIVGFILEAAAIAFIYISSQSTSPIVVTLPIIHDNIPISTIGIIFLIIGIAFQTCSLFFFPIEKSRSPHVDPQIKTHDEHQTQNPFSNAFPKPLPSSSAISTRTTKGITEEVFGLSSKDFTPLEPSNSTRIDPSQEESYKDPQVETRTNNLNVDTFKKIAKSEEKLFSLMSDTRDSFDAFEFPFAPQKSKNKRWFKSTKLFKIELVALLGIILLTALGFIFLVSKTQESPTLLISRLLAHSKNAFAQFMGKPNLELFQLIQNSSRPQYDSTQDNYYDSVSYAAYSAKEKKQIPQRSPATKNSLKISTVDQIYITSDPPGASISFLNKTIGVTPLTWDMPSIYGTMTLQAEKTGYITQQSQFEYMGGTLSKHFSMVSDTSSFAKTTLHTQSQISSTPDSQSALQNTDQLLDNSSDKNRVATATESTTIPDTSTRTQQRSEPSPVFSNDGEMGTLFISSLPPVADILYNNQKIGTTNKDLISLPAGTHLLVFVKGDLRISRSYTVKPGKNPAQLVIFTPPNKHK